MTIAQRLGLIALISLLLGAAGWAWWSAGQPSPAAPVVLPRPPLSDAVAAELAAQRDAREAAERQARAADEAARRLEREAAAAAQAADADRSRLASLAQAIQAAEARLLAAGADLARARTEVAESERQIARVRAPLVELTGALQLMSRRPPATLLFAPDTLDEVIHARALIDAMMPQIRARTAVLAGALAERRRLVAGEQAALAATRARARELDARRAALAQSEAAARARSHRLRASAGLEADRATAVGEGAADLDRLLGTLAEAARIRDDLATLPPPRPRPGQADFAAGAASLAQQPVEDLPGAAVPVGAPRLRLPAVGRVVRGFGAGEGTLQSRGVTLAVAPGALAVAAASGRVAYAGPFRTYQQIVIIDHGGGWSTLITDLLTLEVDVGQQLAAGEPIGRAGPGSPTVGFELRHDGTAVDVTPHLR